MAEHGSLLVGDTVTHPDWGGETAFVLAISPWMRASRVPYGKQGRTRAKLVPSTRDRVVRIDRDMPEEGGGRERDWMELGLERRNPPTRAFATDYARGWLPFGIRAMDGPDLDALAEYALSCDPDHAHPSHGYVWFNMINGYEYRWDGNTGYYHRQGRQKPGLFD